MSKIALRAEHLSKRYRIGLKEKKHDTLGGALADYLLRPFKNLQRLRRLSHFAENGDDAEDIIWALKKVSFEVKEGEVVGIIGRNGAGKSTLLKIFSRITEPTMGRAEVRGRVSSLLEVGTGFHPELTGRENIYLNGTILGMKKREIDRKFDEIVDFSGVEKFIDTPVKRYSSGMQVRLAFAVAAHVEPEVLVVDEVLAVGDAEFQHKCLGRLKEVVRQGRTVLFVSHNMAAVRNLCPRSLLLNGGSLIFDGETAEAIRIYLGEQEEGAGVVERDQLEAQMTGFFVQRAAPVIRLSKVSLLDREGVPRSSFNSDEEICVRIEYRLFRQVTEVGIMLFIQDEGGNTVLASYSGDPQPESIGAELGEYISECVFPKDLFGNHRFYLTLHVLAWGPASEHLVWDHLVMFQVFFQRHGGASWWQGPFVPLRPKLAWSTTRREDRVAHAGGGG